MNIIGFHIAGCLFTIIFGTILHFTYKLSNNNKYVALFSAVNESTFEHLKLLYFPMLISSIIEFFLYGKSLPNFIPIRCISIVFGMFMIVSIFYTYTGVIGNHYLFADISLFLISVVLSFLLSFILLNTSAFSSYTDNIISIVILILLTLSFGLFTFDPPNIGLFKDPSK